MSLSMILPSEFELYNLGAYDRSNGIRYLQVEVTTRCNLTCPSCIHGQGGIDLQTIDLDAFKGIVETVPTLEGVSFVGMGEAMLYPQISELISLCAGRGIKTAITTNGTVGVRRLQSVMFSGLNKMTISIDGHNDQTFSYARGGAKLSSVKVFAANAVELSRQTGAEIWGGVTLTKYNIEYLRDIVSVIADTGIDKIYVESIHHWGTEFSLNEMSVFTLDKKYVSDLIAEALELAKSKAVRMNVFDYEKIFQRGIDGFRLCGWPVDGCVIRADGSVAPCCIQLQSDNRVSFGNIGDTPINEIWLSQPYNNFASSFAAGTEPHYCKQCIYRAEFGE